MFRETVRLHWLTTCTSRPEHHHVARLRTHITLLNSRHVLLVTIIYRIHDDPKKNDPAERCDDTVPYKTETHTNAFTYTRIHQLRSC